MIVAYSKSRYLYIFMAHTQISHYKSTKIRIHAKIKIHAKNFHFSIFIFQFIQPLRPSGTPATRGINSRRLLNIQCNPLISTIRDSDKRRKLQMNIYKMYLTLFARNLLIETQSIASLQSATQ